MSKQELEPEYEVINDPENDPDEIDEEDEQTVQLFRQPDGTYIYDPDEEPVYDRRTKPKKRKRRRKTRNYRKRARTVYRRVKTRIRKPKKATLSGVFQSLLAFTSFWWFGLLFETVKYQASQGTDNLKKYLFNPMWQLKDAITTLTTKKSFEARIANLMENPLPIMAIAGGLIAKYIPYKIKHKGVLTKLLLTFGIFSLVGSLLDPSNPSTQTTNPTGRSTNTQPVKLLENAFKGRR